MKRTRIMGLCLVAVFAAFAAAAASASAYSAAPEWVTKAVVGGGSPGNVKYKNYGALGVKAGTLEGKVSKVKITCKDAVGATTEGETNGPKNSKANETVFTECSTSVGVCENVAPGVIATYPLEGELGLTAGGTKVAQRFWREGKPGYPTAEFSCGGGVLAVQALGSVVGEMTVTGSSESVGKVTFEKYSEVEFAQMAGLQKYSELEPPASYVGPEQLSSASKKTTGETYVLKVWNSAETGATEKIKCGTNETGTAGLLGYVVGNHYVESSFFTPNPVPFPVMLPGSPIDKLPAADLKKYYTVESIYEYEYAREILSLSEATAATLLVETASYAPCEGIEKSGESVDIDRIDADSGGSRVHRVRNQADTQQ